ncbi:hypothetical protein PLESTB_000165800 [Pleodorina starrii]|uniref:Uncharacterized protein n=1 Tax=Pleodorina starrii TaxID=330485 RepID=A0A9W6EY72_9CHLO|nr:hypothetical protein PLESTB_000165800 [Pleodorina starrii]GLC72674.1 hypothetical protein PLESTF_001277200 [Pleodorina starrii]
MRTSRLVIYGALVGTPVGHAWFQLLDTRIMPEAMTSAPAVLTKMTMDQLLMCPLATALFFVVMRCWEGHPNDAVAYMRGKMFPTLKANYVLWPLAHVINFAFVPPAQRILYCNAVGVVWTVILSTILNSKTPPKPSPEAAASGSRGPGPAADGGAGPDDSWGRSPAPGGAGGQAGWPRHVHAAFTPGLMAQATDISGSRCGPGREQPLKGYKRGMQPDVTYGRVLQCDTSSKDA